MKNILVLTDFSACAKRAAETALPIAVKLGADVLLVNVYPITPYLPPVDSAVLPESSAGAKRGESTTCLNREVRRLEKRLRAMELPGRAPVIRPIPLEGQLAERVSALARRKNSVMVMMGVSGRSYGDLLFDGEVKAVLRKVGCPVFVIPLSWAGPEIQHILFATDLAAADEGVIGELVGLSTRLKSRLSLSHVSRPVLIPDFAEETRTSAFMERVRSLYPGIRCHLSREANIMGALEKVGAEKHADVIALRYQKHPCWYRLFHQNPLREAIIQGKMTLLVFPENSHSHD
ncbi:universal stress protein [Mucilaginibacter sp. BJC16-A38]|uniref:universal stress protein n=1 Tax=Mucilaginibacter phenanthrenivorans TaxID=1234842 RepID=UPI002157645F|nr:universal stress protein [Mucilaginibacter phenanthrenivorans]MCR8557806.1 universal stress protein [Mucilaginibacter phenanthrenivorans]